MHTEHDKVTVKLKSTSGTIKAKVSNNINMVAKVSQPTRVKTEIVEVPIDWIDGGFF